jgi:hypothetical protein
MCAPADFAAQLRAMHAPTGPGHRNMRPSIALRCTLVLARRKGWTLQALGDALGLTRERIRQIIAIPFKPGQFTGSPIDIPAPPPRPLTKEEQRRAARKPTPRLTEQEKAQLRELYSRSRAAGKCSPDHPAIVAGKQLAALMDGYLRRGYRISDVAGALRITTPAVQLRLGRYGYRPLPPSQRHNPGPIAAAMAAERGQA